MPRWSMRHSASQTLIIAGLLQCLALACDSPSPTDPRVPPTDPTYVVVPSGVTAAAVSWKEIDVSWPKSSNAATGYEIFRSTTGPTGSYALAGSTAPPATSYADAGLTASTQYCYEIRSFKTAGKNTTYSPFSSAVCATTLALPVAAPSATDVVPAGSSIVRITWIDNSDNEDGFHIEQADVAGGPWTQVATAGANAKVLLQPATPEQQACYRVVGFNAIGPSNPSAADCTTPPAGPTKLFLKGTGESSVQISWTDNSTVEDGYKVFRLTSTTGWIDVATLPANSATYGDVRLSAGEKYTYRIQALKDGGYSDYSNELTVEMPGVGEALPPAAPRNFAASYFADGQNGWLYFNASWTDASPDEAGFSIEVSSDGVSGWTTYARAAANVESLSQPLDLWSNLTPISQCFRVIAFNGQPSPPSNVVCVEWNMAPTNLTATAVDQQSIDLSWTDNARFEKSYLVYRSVDLFDGYELIASLPPKSTNYHDTGLASGQEYWYFVLVYYNSDSPGDGFNYSDLVSATTLTSAPSAQGSSSIVIGQSTSKRVARSVRHIPRIRTSR